MVKEFLRRSDKQVHPPRLTHMCTHIRVHMYVDAHTYIRTQTYISNVSLCSPEGSAGQCAEWKGERTPPGCKGHCLAGQCLVAILSTLQMTVRPLPRSSFIQRMV